MQDISLLTELSIEAHRRKEYRPVVVATILRKDGKALLVSSAMNPTNWGLPQGGIEPDEDLKEALLREIEEETGILPEFLTVTRFIGWRDLDAEASRTDRRGFSKGKRYLFFLLDYRGPDELMVDAREIANYAWASITEADALTGTTRGLKRAMVMQVLKMVRFLRVTT